LKELMENEYLYLVSKATSPKEQMKDLKNASTTGRQKHPAMSLMTAKNSLLGLTSVVAIL